MLNRWVHVRGSLGSLQESLLARLALDALGFLILQRRSSVSDSSERIAKPNLKILTDLICDLAVLEASFALRSRFCEALAPC